MKQPNSGGRPPLLTYLVSMSDTPAFLDSGRPPVPDLVVPRGVLPFFLPQRPVRGRLVRLGPLADALLEPARQPSRGHPACRRGAGARRGLSTALKFRGSFSLQAKGDGPVPILLADCTDAGELRGYAHTSPRRLAALLEARPVALGRGAAGRRAIWRSPSTRAASRTATRASSRSRAAPWRRWRCTISIPASSSAARCGWPAPRPRPAGGPGR